MPPPVPPRRQIGRIDPGPTADSPTAANGAGEYDPSIDNSSIPDDDQMESSWIGGEREQARIK